MGLQVKVPELESWNLRWKECSSLLSPSFRVSTMAHGTCVRMHTHTKHTHNTQLTQRGKERGGGELPAPQSQGPNHLFPMDPLLFFAWDFLPVLSFFKVWPLAEIQL